MKINKNEIQIKHLNTLGDDGNADDDDDEDDVDDVFAHKMCVCFCTQPYQSKNNRNRINFYT